MQAESRMIPLSQWNKFHPWPSVPALRWIRFHGESNGFNRCVLKVGKRVLVDEAKFFQWMQEQNQAGRLS